MTAFLKPLVDALNAADQAAEESRREISSAAAEIGETREACRKILPPLVDQRDAVAGESRQAGWFVFAVRLKICRWGLQLAMCIVILRAIQAYLAIRDAIIAWVYRIARWICRCAIAFLAFPITFLERPARWFRLRERWLRRRALRVATLSRRKKHPPPR